MIKDKSTLITILLFTGIFLFQMPVETSICATPQMVYLFFSAGILGFLCIKKLNKYVAFLFLITILMTCRTYLGDKVSRHYLQQDIIFGVAMFVIYYATRLLDIRQDTLKFLMFPALVNCAFIFIQKFTVPGGFIFPKGITGMVSNGGFTSCFLAMTVSIFFRYFKLGLIPIFMAIVLSGGFIGFIAGIASLFFMLYIRYFKSRKPLFIVLCSLAIALVLFMNARDVIDIRKVDIDYRINAYIGTLDGIKYHFVNGWGIGSFTSIMARVKPEKSKYYNNIAFNDSKTILNHPHNEFLYYWWSLGIIFMIWIVFLIRDYIRKLCDRNIMPFAVLIAAFIDMNGYQLMPPSLFVLMFTMGIYENAYYNKEVTDA